MLVADDHTPLRVGLAATLAAQKGIKLVGQAADGQEAVDQARTLRPDVVVMDITMPKLSGIEATRQISAELPGVKVIGFSVQQQECWARALLDAGAVACLSKFDPIETLIKTIRACRAHARAKS